MKRTIEIIYQNKNSSFTVHKLDRSRLYGTKRKFPVDSQGRVCSKASLTRDGKYILPAGSTALLYLDDAGDVVEREELRAVDADGNVIDFKASSFDTPQELDEVLNPMMVLDFTIRYAYLLDPISIAPELDSSLSEGKIHTFPFRYYEGYGGYQAFMLKNDSGYFLLAGEQNSFDFIKLEESDSSLPDDENNFDDLDFEMM